MRLDPTRFELAARALVQLCLRRYATSVFRHAHVEREAIEDHIL